MSAGEGEWPLALRRLAWRARAARERAEGVEGPVLGTCVGGYWLEARLGRGGYGTVYRAHCEGGLFAVKLIPGALADTWGRRELEVLARLRVPGIAALEGHGHWPPVAPRFLFLVTRYVKGRTLYAWARGTGPTARGVGDKTRALARVLAAVHREGVVHRDVKGANVLVREGGDEEVVLVDFGASGYPSAPRLTVHLPPGTPHYRGPEALRFLRARLPGERYVSTPGDDLWALGVLLYWLLTGRWPFDVEREPEAALYLEPEPPQALNPRVPPALGALCLRLLEKEPGARLADAEAVAGALETALAGADGAWDVPLEADYGADQATTLGEAPPEADAAEREEAPRGEPSPGGDRPARKGRLGGVLVLVLVLGLGVLQSLSGQEVAPPGRPLEPDAGAVPAMRASTPAPVVRPTMLREEDMRLNQDTKTKKTAARVLGVGLVCQALAGCPAPQRQLRPAPVPTECPEGAAEAMASQLEMLTGETASASFVSSGAVLMPVREGPVELYFMKVDKHLKGRWGKRLFGTLIFDRERVYGRFTQARIDEGPIFPVCLELTGLYGSKTPGVHMEDAAGLPDSATVYSGVGVMAVRKFK